MWFCINFLNFVYNQPHLCSNINLIKNGKVKSFCDCRCHVNRISIGQLVQDQQSGHTNTQNPLTVSLPARTDRPIGPTSGIKSQSTNFGGHFFFFKLGRYVWDKAKGRTIAGSAAA